MTATVIYNNGGEDYSDIKVNGRATGGRMQDQKGPRSTGEFATLLASVMSPDRRASFRRRGEERVAGRDTLVFDYEVRPENSNWTINTEPGSTITAGYDGAIWIDRETRQILRVESRAKGFPANFAIQRVDTTLDYGFVKMEDDTRLMPMVSESVSCGGGQCSRNSTRFDSFRKVGEAGPHPPTPGNPDANGVYRSGDGVSLPTLLHKVEPEYSEEARKAKIAGVVVLYFVIGPDGKPSSVRVMKGLGYGLDQKAIDAVEKWKFDPSRKDGKPVSVAATVEVNFRPL